MITKSNSLYYIGKLEQDPNYYWEEDVVNNPPNIAFFAGIGSLCDKVEENDDIVGMLNNESDYYKQLAEDIKWVKDTFSDVVIFSDDEYNLYLSVLIPIQQFNDYLAQKK